MRTLTSTFTLMALAHVVASTAPAFAVDLAPTADTYIEAGAEEALVHGSERILEVDRDPFGVIYLRFDLRGLSGAITRAVLRLTVANGSRDAGYVFKVDNGWTETLRWIDVDRNGDGDLDTSDGTPLVPVPNLAVARVGGNTAGQIQDIDVTAAFAAGPGIYSLAIMNTSSDGASFWSREDATRKPLLSVTTGSVPPSPPPPASTCLAGTGPLVRASGTFTTTWSKRSLARYTRIDARDGTFVGGSNNNYPITLGGGSDMCIASGLVKGTYSRTASWDAMHSNNNSGITWDSLRFLVEGLRIDNVTDGIRPRAGTEGFAVRGVHLSWIRDDCVENDHLNGGLVDDSLFDGCYVGFSSRPGSGDSTSDGRNRIWRIENSLVRLQPMPGPRPGSNSYPDGLGHGPFFKVDNWDDPADSRSPRFIIKNNIFRADRVGQESDRRMGIPPGHVLECSNNVMVWLGPGSYPASLPSCFRVTKDKAVWDAAVARWKTAHGE